MNPYDIANAAIRRALDIRRLADAGSTRKNPETPSPGNLLEGLIPKQYQPAYAVLKPTALGDGTLDNARAQGWMR